jgi:hypothetical protein
MSNASNRELVEINPKASASFRRMEVLHSARCAAGKAARARSCGKTGQAYRLGKVVWRKDGKTTRCV